MSPFIPGILHSCPAECSGIPATVLPPSTASMNKDVSHFAITEAILWKGLNECQDEDQARRGQGRGRGARDFLTAGDERRAGRRGRSGWPPSGLTLVQTRLHAAE